MIWFLHKHKVSSILNIAIINKVYPLHNQQAIKTSTSTETLFLDQQNYTSCSKAEGVLK